MPSSSQGSSSGSLAVCRWLWCKESFSTHNQLVEHVLNEHVAKAVPIKLKDLPLELRAQDGTNFQGMSCNNLHTVNY